MIEVIPFDIAHLDIVKVSDVHNDDPNLIKHYQEGLVAMTYGYTIIDRDACQVLGIMNGIHVHPGLLEVCMIVTNAAYHKPLGFFKAVNNTLDERIETLNLVRVQASIRSGHPYLIKWMKLLGFEYEATLKKYGIDGDDYMIYSRILR